MDAATMGAAERLEDRLLLPSVADLLRQRVPQLVVDDDACGLSLAKDERATKTQTSPRG